MHITLTTIEDFEFNIQLNIVWFGAHSEDIDEHIVHS